MPRYILSISLLPAQGFSRRNLPSYPTSCPSPFSVGAGWALGSLLQAQPAGPCWDTQAEELRAHGRAGSTCWSMLLPWLLASQANAGSQPSSWSVQLFQEAPWEGEGPVTVSISAFSSYPLGKTETAKPSLRAHLPKAAQQPVTGT